jgi:hypothetical protein
MATVVDWPLIGPVEFDPEPEVDVFPPQPVIVKAMAEMQSANWRNLKPAPPRRLSSSSLKVDFIGAPLKVQNRATRSVRGKVTTENTGCL